MRGPTSNADLDYLAREMGHTGGMAEIQEKRRAEEAAKRKAELEAEERACAEEERQRTLAEDVEISAALRSKRMTIEINGHHYDAKGFKDLTCPECGKLPNFIRETSLLSIRRATFRGELGIPAWYRRVADIRYDMIPAGASANGLRVMAQTLLFKGLTPCTECGAELELAIEVDCVHDGQPVKSIRKRGKE